MKRIALYYPWIYLTSGVERMILELVKRSRHDWVVFTSHYYPDQTYPELRDIPIVELSKVPVSRKFSAVSNAAVTILKQKINLSNFDALVVSSEGLGDLITFRNHGIPVICYCHTPLKVIHDPHTRKRWLEKNRFLTPWFFFYSTMFKAVDRRAWRHYHHIFCNSLEVKRRIVKAGLADSDAIEILHPGLDVRRMVASENFSNYFLVAGRIKWFKNIELALDAFQEFKKRYPEFDEFQLHIAGRVEPRSQGYFLELQRKAANRSDIIFHSNPTDEELAELYSEAYTLLFTSLNEDWGMVPLEAMGFGKPVISVNRGGPTESISDGVTGLLVESDKVKLARAMAKMAAEPEMTRQMGRAAAASVQKYDWDQFVGQFDSYLDQL